MNRNIIDLLTQYGAKYKFIAPYLGMNVLDIGCGSGVLIPLLQEGASYIGIDVDPAYIDRLEPVAQTPSHICDIGW